MRSPNAYWPQNFLRWAPNAPGFSYEHYTLPSYGSVSAVSCSGHSTTGNLEKPVSLRIEFCGDFMFTGIIEEVGKVARIQQRGENRRITIEAANTPKELRTGDSILRRSGPRDLGAHIILPHSRRSARQPRTSHESRWPFRRPHRSGTRG